MIRLQKELQFYIMADTMINRGYFTPPLNKRIMQLFNPDIVVDFLCYMRKFSYYSHQVGLRNRIKAVYYKFKFLKSSKKCGFSIGADCFGYGLLIHHYGTIVCGNNNRIGNFAVLNTSTCITQNGSKVGNFFFMGTGAVISEGIELGNNVKVAANSVITMSNCESNITLAGQPGVIRKQSPNTWIDDYDGLNSSRWRDRYHKIEDLKTKMSL